MRQLPEIYETQSLKRKCVRAHREHITFRRDDPTYSWTMVCEPPQAPEKAMKMERDAMQVHLRPSKSLNLDQMISPPISEISRRQGTIKIPGLIFY